MGIRQIALGLFIGGFLQLSANPAQILFLVQAGNTNQAVTQYREEFTKSGSHNYELLQQMAITLLDQGRRSTKPEDQLLSILGAGISLHDRVSYILEAGVSSDYPQLQLVSMQLISRFQSDDAYYALNQAMRSNNPLIRLEAAHIMAQIKHPKAVGQIEALMQKLPVEVHALFPQLYALEGSHDAIRTLARMLSHPREEVRIAAILSAAKHKRDDLLPQIRRLAKHHSIPQQEASAWTLGIMRDADSVEILKEMLQSPSSNVRLAAMQSLYRVGHKEYGKDIIRLARREDPFAIAFLGEVDDAQDVLVELLKSDNLSIRINAGIALLDHRDYRGIAYMRDLFLPEQRDLALLKVTTSGGALSCYKLMPAATYRAKDDPLVYELSLSLREQILTKCLELPEKYFLGLIEELLIHKQHDIIPLAMNLLVNQQSPAGVALLKKYHQHAGAPFIRMYCTLALYKMREEGTYGAQLREWATKQQGEDFIQLREYLPWEMRDASTKYEITPRETSRLLLESFESFAQVQDEAAIDAILEAIQHGNRSNRYALAGLLIRMVQ
jgi:HEAT repeat protein